MTIHVYHGTDIFAIEQAIRELIGEMNYQSITHETNADITRLIQRLRQRRLDDTTTWIWLRQANILQAGQTGQAKALQEELTHILIGGKVARNLIIMCESKPHGQLKLVKWLIANETV